MHRLDTIADALVAGSAVLVLAAFAAFVGGTALGVFAEPPGVTVQVSGTDSGAPHGSDGASHGGGYGGY
ncbi:MAG: hypothetical protein FJ035_05095 [Chloroflexi bacterium]|nr:hypothetical protein [Chloroflexota bacterium]